MKHTKTPSPQQARAVKPMTRRTAERLIASTAAEALPPELAKHANKHVRAKYEHKLAGAK